MEGTLHRGVTLPRVLGHEVAGVVIATGAQVDQSLLGRAAVLMPGDLGHRSNGGFADFLVAPSRAVVTLPPESLLSSAALLASPTGVALKAVDTLNIDTGDTIVITGVSGGVGLQAAQIVHTLGGTVIGITGSKNKLSALEQKPWLDRVVLDQEPWPDLVRAFTDDYGAHGALDTVGNSLSRLVTSVRPGGHIVLVGQVLPQAVPVSPSEIIFRGLTITGSLGASRIHVERSIALVQSGEIETVIDEELKLSSAAVTEAYHRIKERRVIGRLIICP
jgi:D-arabinose 1-dehydrogenase-like Zn-dependent alcohol dehydrogenase